jgi:hypothetical protein
VERLRHEIGEGVAIMKILAELDDRIEKPESLWGMRISARGMFASQTLRPQLAFSSSGHDTNRLDTVMA